MPSVIALPPACSPSGDRLQGDREYYDLRKEGEPITLFPLVAATSGVQNLIQNGTFDSDTVWTKGAFWTIGGGKAVRAVDIASSSLSQNVTFVTGATYEVTFTIDAISAGGIAPRFLGGTPVNGTTRNAPGTYTQNLVAQTGNNQFTLIAIGGTGATIDNVIVRRV